MHGRRESELSHGVDIDGEKERSQKEREREREKHFKYEQQRQWLNLLTAQRASMDLQNYYRLNLNLLNL